YVRQCLHSYRTSGKTRKASPFYYEKKNDILTKFRRTKPQGTHKEGEDHEAEEGDPEVTHKSELECAKYLLKTEETTWKKKRKRNEIWKHLIMEDRMKETTTNLASDTSAGAKRMKELRLKGDKPHPILTLPTINH